MICSNCGTENEQGAAFCGNCGVVQNEANSSVVGSDFQQRVGRVGFPDAVRLGLKGWNDFQGRSTRAEFWWFTLFTILASFLGGAIDAILVSVGVVQVIIQFALMIPGVAVGARRLHDINRTGWWQLSYLGFALIIPGLIAWAVLWYWAVQPSDQGSNRFGPRP